MVQPMRLFKWIASIDLATMDRAWTKIASLPALVGRAISSSLGGTRKRLGELEGDSAADARSIIGSRSVIGKDFQVITVPMSWSKPIHRPLRLWSKERESAVRFVVGDVKVFRFSYMWWR